MTGHTNQNQEIIMDEMAKAPTGHFLYTRQCVETAIRTVDAKRGGEMELPLLPRSQNSVRQETGQVVSPPHHICQTQISKGKQQPC